MSAKPSSIAADDWFWRSAHWRSESVSSTWRWRPICRAISAPGWSSASACGAGLYDTAFATLGRLYGHDARSAITSLTLFSGFASTVCWPLSAFLVSDIWEGRGRRRGHARRIAAALADDIPVLMSVGELAIPALELFGDDLCRIVEAESPFVRDWLLNKFGSEMARGATMAIRGSLQTQDV